MRPLSVLVFVLFALAVVYGLLFFFPPEEASEEGRALTTPFFLVALALFIYVSLRWRRSRKHTKHTQ